MVFAGQRPHAMQMIRHYSDSINFKGPFCHDMFQCEPEPFNRIFIGQ